MYEQVEPKQRFDINGSFNSHQAQEENQDSHPDNGQQEDYISKRSLGDQTTNEVDRKKSQTSISEAKDERESLHQFMEDYCQEIDLANAQIVGGILNPSYPTMVMTVSRFFVPDDMKFLDRNYKQRDLKNEYFERKKQVMDFWIDDNYGTSMLAEFRLNKDATYSKHMAFSFDSNLVALTTVETREIHIFDITSHMKIMKELANLTKENHEMVGVIESNQFKSREMGFDDQSDSDPLDKNRNELYEQLQDLNKDMLVPIHVMKDEEDENGVKDTFHKNLKMLKMSDALIVTYSHKQIRLYSIEDGEDGKKIIKPKGEDGSPIFFTINQDSDTAKYKKVVDCFISEKDASGTDEETMEDDHIVYALQVKGKQKVKIFTKEAPNDDEEVEEEEEDENQGEDYEQDDSDESDSVSESDEDNKKEQLTIVYRSTKDTFQMSSSRDCSSILFSIDQETYRYNKKLQKQITMKNLDQKYILKCTYDEYTRNYFAIYQKQKGSFEMYLNCNRQDSQPILLPIQYKPEKGAVQILDMHTHIEHQREDHVVHVHVKILLNLANESIQSLTYTMVLNSHKKSYGLVAQKSVYGQNRNENDLRFTIQDNLKLSVESVIVQQLYDFKYPFIVTTLGRKFVIVYALTKPTHPFCIDFNMTHEAGQQYDEDQGDQAKEQLSKNGSKSVVQNIQLQDDLKLIVTIEDEDKFDFTAINLNKYCRPLGKLPKKLISKTFYTIDKSELGNLAVTENYAKFVGFQDDNFIFLRLGEQMRITKTDTEIDPLKSQDKKIDRFRPVDDRFLYYIERTKSISYIERVQINFSDYVIKKVYQDSDGNIIDFWVDRTYTNYIYCIVQTLDEVPRYILKLLYTDPISQVTTVKWENVADEDDYQAIFTLISQSKCASNGLLMGQDLVFDLTDNTSPTLYESILGDNANKVTSVNSPYMNSDRRRLCYIINPNEQHNHATITPFLNDRKIQLFRSDQTATMDQFNMFVKREHSSFILSYYTEGKTLRVLEKSGKIVCNKDITEFISSRGTLTCVSQSGMTWVFQKDEDYYIYKVNPLESELDDQFEDYYKNLYKMRNKEKGDIKLDELKMIKKLSKSIYKDAKKQKHSKDLDVIVLKFGERKELKIVLAMARKIKQSDFYDLIDETKVNLSNTLTQVNDNSDLMLTWKLGNKLGLAIIGQKHTGTQRSQFKVQFQANKKNHKYVKKAVLDTHCLFIWGEKQIFRFPFAQEVKGGLLNFQNINETIKNGDIKILNKFELPITLSESQSLIYRRVQPTTNPNSSLINILIEVSEDNFMAIVYDHEKGEQLDHQNYSQKYVVVHQEGGNFKCITDESLVFHNDLTFKQDGSQENKALDCKCHEEVIQGKSVSDLMNNFYFSYDLEQKLNTPVGMKPKTFHQKRKKKNKGEQFRLDNLSQCGYKVEPNMQEVFLHRNVIYMPYSYFNFIVQEKVATDGLSSDNFNPIAYQCNYKGLNIFHKKYQSYEILNEIIQGYQREDPAQLQMLIQNNLKFQTPLDFVCGLQEGAAVINKSQNIKALLSKSDESVEDYVEDGGKGNKQIQSLIMQTLFSSESIDQVKSKHFKSVFSIAMDFSGFDEFMTKEMFQTPQMKRISTLNLKNFNGQMIASSKSSLIDKQFLKKHTDPDAQSYFVNLSIMEVGWIYNSKEGKMFLEKLADTDELGIFRNKTVQVLIDFMWESVYRKKMMRFVLMPYLVFFGCFFYNRSFTLTPFIIYLESQNDDNVTLQNALQTVLNHYPTTLACIVFTVLNLITEVRQMMKSSDGSYFASMWNWCDLLQISSALFLNLFDIYCYFWPSMMTENYGAIYSLSSLSLYLCYIKLFYFLRLIPRFSYMVRLIINVFSSVIEFIIIFILFLVCTGNCMYILQQSGELEHIDDPDYDPDDTFASTFMDSLLYSFEMAIGDVNYDFSTSYNQTTCYVVYIFSVWILNIMLLNMIINIMGAAQDDTMAVAEESKRQEQISLILENPQIGEVGQDCKIQELNDPYLILIKEIDTDGNDKDMKDDESKKNQEELDDRISGLEDMLVQIQSDIKFIKTEALSQKADEKA